jgi:prepilin-type N-terminal cleavage/methylation domain-containing protein
MIATRSTSGPNGFTLVEIIAVLLILSVLAAISVPKFISLDANAKEHGIHSGIAELNGRETLVWANTRLASPDGWQNDDQVFAGIDTDLGTDYKWIGAVDANGGTLEFRASASAVLTRVSSDSRTPGRWTRNNNP